MIGSARIEMIGNFRFIASAAKGRFNIHLFVV